MKPITYIAALILIAATSATTVLAQESRGIIEELNRVSSGKARVRIYQDEAIVGLVGRTMVSSSYHVVTSDDGQTQYAVMRGFKIQAFAGNDPRTARNEAYSKQSQINNVYPELETVINFDSPFWRLRVGNFKSREEAEEVMKAMRRSFPSFGKEMYVVADEVKIEIDNL